MRRLTRFSLFAAGLLPALLLSATLGGCSGKLVGPVDDGASEEDDLIRRLKAAATNKPPFCAHMCTQPGSCVTFCLDHDQCVNMCELICANMCGGYAYADGGAVTPDAGAPPPDQGAPLPDLAAPDASPPAPDAGSAVPYTGTFPSGTGDQTATITVAGHARTVYIYRPTSAGAGAPLMLAFHGTHGTGWDMVKPYSVFARELADQQGVVVVAPSARKMTTGDWDDHYPNDVYWETYPSVDPSQNPDLLLVQALIQEAHRAYSVDLKRVYTLGHSSGGFFSILTAMSLPNRIAAFVSNSAGLVRCATKGACSFVGSGTSCSAMEGMSGYCACTGAEKPGPVATTGRKPPGYLVHSSDDSVVSVAYTCELGKRLAALGYTYSLNIVTGNGHSVPYNLAVDAWPFLSKYTLP